LWISASAYKILSLVLKVNWEKEKRGKQIIVKKNYSANTEKVHVAAGMPFFIDYHSVNQEFLVTVV